MLVRHQCAPAEKSSNSLLGCTMKSIASRLREMIIPLYQHWWDTTGMWGPILGSPVEGRHGHTMVGPGKGHKDD